MNKPGYVYIMASKKNGTIYIGVTSNLIQRAYQHRSGLIDGFTKQYRCTMLVWFETFDSIAEARACELRMKKWNRAWKVSRIVERNPDWSDLFPTLF